MINLEIVHRVATFRSTPRRAIENLPNRMYGCQSRDGAGCGVIDAVYVTVERSPSKGSSPNCLILTQIIWPLSMMERGDKAGVVEGITVYLDAGVGWA